VTHAAHIPLGPGSEFDAVRATIARWGTLARGTGDDAAILDVPAGRQLVMSTDTTVEGVHFRRGWLSSEELAYRAGAAAISDLAAMGAAPLAMTVALTLPAPWRDQAMALADGIAIIARDAETPIVGGDLTDGSELAIGVTVIGTVVPGEVLRRNGAQVGDVLYVTGTLGGPLLALEAWERGREPRPLHRARFARPVPRLREGAWLAAHGVRCALDISDGVASDAAHLAAASRRTLVLDLEALPLVAGARAEHGARSGEEYELLIAAPPTLDVAAFTAATGTRLTAIGRVEAPGADGPGVIVRRDGIVVPLPKGHDHFAD
jgi:thiamine-monophosphate kinase